MQKRNSDVFKNPIHLVRPITVDSKRIFERRKNAEKAGSERRPKSSGTELSALHATDFQSNSTSSGFSLANDEDYDTDLEDDAPDFDHSCIGIYKRVCQFENIVPVGHYLKKYDQRELIMRFYGLGSKGIRGFLPSLGRNTYITKLDLTSNGLGDKGALFLSRILRDNVAVTDLNLSHNFITVFGARELVNMLKDNRTINHLQFEGNLLDDECARLLGDLISSSGLIRTLNLSKNRLESASGVFLGRALVENTTMESLDLSWNSIGGKGAVALIKGIQENVFLKKLNLAHNALAGGECGRAWFNAFKVNTSLVELDLSHNRLTAEPATLIGRGIAKSESLEKIFLAGNPLESAGCYAILKPFIAKDVVQNKLELIDFTEIPLNSDFHDLYSLVKSQRPEILIIIGTRPQPKLLKRPPPKPSPIERLRTLFQRRPELDLANFFYSVATNDDEDPSNARITDHYLFKQTIQERLNGRFSDEDIHKVLEEINQYDCKKFVHTFETKPTTASFASASWRFKS